MCNMLYHRVQLITSPRYYVRLDICDIEVMRFGCDVRLLLYTGEHFPISYSLFSMNCCVLSVGCVSAPENIF